MQMQQMQESNKALLRKGLGNRVITNRGNEKKKS